MSSISLAGYLDPGTGSVILQAILGGVAAAAVTAKLWWHRVTSIFRRGSDRTAGAEADSAGSDPAQG
jgi:hypothetical protein